MVKKAGDWTSSLFDLAQEVDVGEGGSGSRKVKVMLTGPYGSLCMRDCRSIYSPSYSAL